MMKASLAISVPLWQLLLVLVLPVLYVANTYAPWTQSLWVAGDKSYYYAFWLSVLAVHIFSGCVVAYFLVKNEISRASIGLTTSGQKISTVLICLIVAGLIAVSFRIIAGYENTDHLGFQIGWPETTNQRLFWILMYLAAGFLEELVFRGFALTALRGRGIADWLAVLISCLSFSLIHGAADLVITAIAFFWGVIFSAVYLWRKSLLLVMTIHALADWTFILTP